VEFGYSEVRSHQVKKMMMKLNRTTLRWLAVTAFVVAVLSLTRISTSAQLPEDTWIRGVWNMEEYVMPGGATHPVRGRIFFTDRDWMVLFFLLDGDGVARRGSAEGGTYTLEGERLVFHHEYNFMGGDALPGLPAKDFTMSVREPESAEIQPIQATVVDDDVMTFYFPKYGTRITMRKR
jgi:hypothetical protein